MERAAQRSLGDYALADEEQHLRDFYYKELRACVDDLLIGFKPHGLEVCDALIRNAAELAELYHEPRGYLLGLVRRAMAEQAPGSLRSGGRR